MESLVNGVKWLFDDENTDPRTRGWFLSSSPTYVIVIVTSYLFFTLRCGQKFMENRKPYELKNTLIVYNALQVLLSVYLVVGGYLAGWKDDYSIFCQPLDYEDNPVSRAMHKMAWWYYFAKLTELLDTVFFVLRKKYNQITFLHVYHHASMPLFAYMGLRYFPNGHGTFFGLLNSFVHIIMYAYYLIAGLGPQYQKYLWWKKHVTTIQLIQFSLIFLHNFPHLFSSCTYPKTLHLLLVLESALFMYLFGKFYVQSYKKETKKAQLNGSSNGVSNGVKNGVTNGNAEGKRKLRRQNVG